ncbi:Hypp6574 [Branchiostoma lanceolatum]|uniref:Hypp6574 protein n=1 Tax=Branchiostoma lanceolatum TaxID=7740 RepID=A0A8J9YV90_BRALA|nr:Hypp6574 [Branchiostoma lanceolatum]
MPSKTTTDMKTTINKAELMTALGMVNYLAKFTPHLSEVTAPLRDHELLKEDIEYVWYSKREDAFADMRKVHSRRQQGGDSSAPRFIPPRQQSGGRSAAESIPPQQKGGGSSAAQSIPPQQQGGGSSAAQSIPPQQQAIHVEPRGVSPPRAASRHPNTPLSRVPPGMCLRQGPHPPTDHNSSLRRIARPQCRPGRPVLSQPQADRRKGLPPPMRSTHTPARLVLSSNPRPRQPARCPPNP